MTIAPGERFDPLADPPEPGHRKLSFGLGTFAGFQAGGVDVLRFAWDQVLLPLAAWAGPVLQPLSEEDAAALATLAAFYVFYRTKEKL